MPSSGTPGSARSWGFAAEEPKDTAGYFKLDYRGARFSLGYPACPDMEDRRKVTELLKPERMGVIRRDELTLHPEQSTDAFVFHHPEAKYFKVHIGAAVKGCSHGHLISRI